MSSDKNSNVDTAVNVDVSETRKKCAVANTTETETRFTSVEASTAKKQTKLDSYFRADGDVPKDSDLNDSEGTQKVRSSVPKELKLNSESENTTKSDSDSVSLVEESKTEIEENNKSDENIKAETTNDSSSKGKQSVKESENIEESIEVDNPSEDEPIEVDDTEEIEYSQSQTQSYHAGSSGELKAEDLKYTSKDFETDSDPEESNSGDKKSLTERIKTDKNMDYRLGKTRISKRHKYQEDSSEGETETPWQPSRKNFNKKPWSSRASGLAGLKRQWSDLDTKVYRDGYPGKKDNPRDNLNLKFYKGEIRSKPDGAYIDEFHNDWWNNLDRLESHHGYIQWLFPIRENGMNWSAQELQLHEAKAIQKDKKLLQKFVRSYEMMLNFYGIRLVDNKNGDVERADNWEPRFRHLNSSMHNYLRITRILKCLGELGLERFKAPLLRFLLHEAIITGFLDRTLDSCCNYWIGTLRNDEEREEVRKFAEKLYSQPHLVLDQ